MQHPSPTVPTCTNLGIRGASDALMLFEAVRQGLRPLRRHRLSQIERDNLAAGQVFVWIESTEADGLERWTDGRKWSASRTRDVFLIYEERDEPSLDESLEKASRRINSYFSDSEAAPEDLFGIFAFPRDRPPKPDGLMKQTFSAWVNDPSGSRTKWHLSAYLSASGANDLPRVADDPILGSIHVPQGIYECCTGPRRHRKPSTRQQQADPGRINAYPMTRKKSRTPQSQNQNQNYSSGDSSPSLHMLSIPRNSAPRQAFGATTRGGGGGGGGAGGGGSDASSYGLLSPPNTPAWPSTANASGGGGGGASRYPLGPVSASTTAPERDEWAATSSGSSYTPTSQTSRSSSSYPSPSDPYMTTLPPMTTSKDSWRPFPPSPYHSHSHSPIIATAAATAGAAAGARNHSLMVGPHHVHVAPLYLRDRERERERESESDAGVRLPSLLDTQQHSSSRTDIDSKTLASFRIF